MTHKEPRAGYVGSRTVKENNRQYKGPDRKKALRDQEYDFERDAPIYERLKHVASNRKKK